MFCVGKGWLGHGVPRWLRNWEKCQGLISLVPKSEVSSLAFRSFPKLQVWVCWVERVKFEAEIASSGFGCPAEILGWGRAVDHLYLWGCRVFWMKGVPTCADNNEMQFLLRYWRICFLAFVAGGPGVLRSTPSFRSPEIRSIWWRSFEDFLLEDFNCCLSDDDWARASLPEHWGGFGVRSVSSLVVPAFLALSAAVLSLVEACCRKGYGPLHSVMTEAEFPGCGWWAVYCFHAPASEQRGFYWLGLQTEVQFSCWEGGRCGKGLHASCAAPNSDCWLVGLPSPSLGLGLGDEWA